jgi:hypothetical protein
VTQQQRDALDQLLRDVPLDLGGHVAEQRVVFEEMMAAIPSPADVTTSSGTLGGIPVVLHHTDCGIKGLAGYTEMLAEFFEIAVTDLDAKAVSDPYAAVRIDVDILRRALPGGLLVSGLVYDTDTGLIEVVVPPAT